KAREGSVEAGELGARCDLAVGLDLRDLGGVDGLDMRRAAGSGAEDQIRQAVRVQIIRGDAYSAGETGGKGVEAGDKGAGRDLAVRLNLSGFGAVDDFDVRHAARAGADDEVASAAVHVADRHVDAAAEARGESEELGQQGAIRDLAVGLALAQFQCVDDLDLGSGAGSGADHDVGVVVAVEVPGGDEDAAAEAGAESAEAGQHRPTRDLAVGLDLIGFGAVDDLDLRAAAGTCADDDIRVAIVVDVGGGNEDAAAEAGGEGEEAGQETAVAAFKDLDLRRAARPHGGDDI